MSVVNIQTNIDLQLRSMPTEARKVCVGCGKSVNKGAVQGCSNDLFRFFISARSCKKIERLEDACRKCRSKFDNWLRKNRDEFNDLFVQKEFDDQPVSSPDSLSDDTSKLPIIESTHSRTFYPNRFDSRHCTGSYHESSCISSVSCCVNKHKVTESLFRVCFVCQEKDHGTFKVISEDQRRMVFVKRGMLVPVGNRCCSVHLYNGHLSYEATQEINASITDVMCLDSNAVALLVDDCCKTAREMKTFDFDDPSSLDNEAYYNITGLKKGNSFVVRDDSYEII